MKKVIKHDAQRIEVFFECFLLELASEVLACREKLCHIAPRTKSLNKLQHSVPHLAVVIYLDLKSAADASARNACEQSRLLSRSLRFHSKVLFDFFCA